MKPVENIFPVETFYNLCRFQTINENSILLKKNDEIEMG